MSAFVYENYPRTHWIHCVLEQGHGGPCLNANGEKRCTFPACNSVVTPNRSKCKYHGRKDREYQALRRSYAREDGACLRCYGRRTGEVCYGGSRHNFPKGQ